MPLNGVPTIVRAAYMPSAANCGAMSKANAAVRTPAAARKARMSTRAPIQATQSTNAANATGRLFNGISTRRPIATNTIAVSANCASRRWSAGRFVSMMRPATSVAAVAAISATMPQIGKLPNNVVGARTRAASTTS